MRILVVGASGMLGTDVVAEFTRRGHDVVGYFLIEELDITDPVAVAELASNAHRAQWCLNCAAYTAVDKAESEREAAFALNTLAPGYLAGACAMAGIKFLHLSTDFVFDGEAPTPYEEDAPTKPLGYYGLTKRDGEDAVLAGLPTALIVRTAWLYGPNGPSFPRTMIRAWEAGKSLRVVADQVGCPTYTGDLARTLADLVEKDAYPGIYHAVGPEIMSWHEFALRTLKVWEARKSSPRKVEIEPIPTEAYPTPARRPKYSVLSTKKLEGEGISAMRSVDEALAEFTNRGAALEGWTS